MPTPVPAGAIRHTGGCLQPVLLRGRADYIDGGTGELIHRYTTVHEPGGVLPIACKTRRASRCPPCAEVYRADTYQLIRAGLTGGKGIPATVADHPCVFVTLTAPSFGPVHARREKDGRVLACRPRRKGKTCPHGIRPVLRREARPGRPPARRAAVPGLLRLHRGGPVQRLRPRTVAPLHHHPAPDPGPPGRAHRQGPRRPGPGLLRQGRRIPAPRRRPLPRHHPARRPRRAEPTPPPAWATLALLTAAIDQAARAVSVTTPAAPGLPARTLAWGRQLDIRPVTASGDVTDTKVAGYVAKYATKAAECTGTLDRRITPADRLADLPVRDHARRHIAECLRLGKLPQLKDLRLAAWAHMLGFRGHFSTKSRAYSITLGSLRADRAAHQREYAIAAGLQPDLDPGTTLVVTDWHYAGRGDPLIDLLLPMGGAPCPGS